MMTIEDCELVFLAAGVDEYTKHDTEFRELIVLAINQLDRWTDEQRDRDSIFVIQKQDGSGKKSHHPKWTIHGLDGVS